MNDRASKLADIRERAQQRGGTYYEKHSDVLFLLNELDRQHDEFYNEVRISMQEKDDLFRERKKLLEQIAEKNREIEWLRQDRESLEGRLAMWKGHEA